MKTLCIRCAICDRLVNRIEAWHDQIRDVYVVKVYCHGDTDQMEIRPYDLEKRQFDMIYETEGLAFMTKRIKDEP